METAGEQLLTGKHVEYSSQKSSACLARIFPHIRSSGITISADLHFAARILRGYWMNRQSLRTRDEMMRHRLRIFTGEDEATQTETANVTVRLGDISRALIDATRWNRTWVSDFADDEIQVSSDLYEILSAYMRYRPGA